MIMINELFSGIGAQVAALKRLGIDYKIVGVSEIDKFAIQSYEAINGTTNNFGDITQIKELPYADLWTYSFPCQDLSYAGKQAGVSNSQLYKQAGNSIVVDVLSAIFKQMFNHTFELVDSNGQFLFHLTATEVRFNKNDEDRLRFGVVKKARSSSATFMKTPNF